MPKQLEQLGNDRLDQRGDGKRVIHARLRIAHADFECVEERVQANVPPDFLRVIDAPGFDEQLAVILVLGERFERIRNAGARKTLEHFEPVAFQSGVVPNPERRVD